MCVRLHDPPTGAWLYLTATEQVLPEETGVRAAHKSEGSTTSTAPAAGMLVQ